MPPGQKRNRKQRARLHHHFTLHEDSLDADRQLDSLDGLEEEAVRTRFFWPVSNSQRTARFAVSVDVNGMALDALVDTGAEVSVLYRKAYQLMDPRPPGHR